MEDASWDTHLYLKTGKQWNPHYCPMGLRLWLSASLWAGNVQEGLLKTKLREGSMLCWKDARKLVEVQGLDMDAQLRTLLADEAEDFAVRFLYSSCDSSLQPLSEPLQLNAIWLDGDRISVGGECESCSFDAGSWRPQCLVITNSRSDLWYCHTEFVSGLEALCLDNVTQPAACHDAFQRLRVLHWNLIDGATGLEFLGSMSSLETLILSRLIRSSEFPAVIRKLSNLRQLNIHIDYIGTEPFSSAPCNLPDWLGELVRLEKLRLECGKLVSPSSVGALPSLRRLSLRCFIRAESLGMISNLQSLEELSLKMYGGTALPLAITALTRLTKLKLHGALKLLGTRKYPLPKAFNIRCFPQLKLLRLSEYVFKSLDKTRLPKMEKGKEDYSWDGLSDIHEAKAPFSWAGASQSMHPTVVKIAELGISLEQHSRDKRGVASTDVEGAVPAEAVDEVRSGPEQIGPAMAVPAHSLVRFADFTQPLVAACTSLQQHEPSGTAAGSQGSRKGQELCCMKCTHMDQKPVPLRKHECPLEDNKWEDIERETDRSSHGLRKRARQATLEQALEPLPEPAPNVERAHEIRSLDNKTVEKMRTVVSAMERLGEIPKMLEDMTKKYELRDIERMSIKMEDRYDALRDELNGLFQLLGTDITTMLRTKD